MTGVGAGVSFGMTCPWVITAWQLLQQMSPVSSPEPVLPGFSGSLPIQRSKSDGFTLPTLGNVQIGSPLKYTVGVPPFSGEYVPVTVVNWFPYCEVLNEVLNSVSLQLPALLQI